MEKKKVFSEGLIFKRKREGAPDFVKGSISVKVDEFKAFLDKHADNGWVNLDILNSKPTAEKPKGIIYFALNEWKPAENKNPADSMREGMGDNFEIPNNPFNE